MLDALEAHHLAQKGTAVGSNGLQSGCSAGLVATVAALRPPLAPIQTAGSARAAQHVGESTNLHSASMGPLDAWQHAGSRQPHPAAAMQPRWQQPMQAQQCAVRPGSCGTHSLSGFREAAAMSAFVPRSSMHRQQPEQLHHSAAAPPGAESAQTFPGSSSAQQGFAAAMTSASCLPSHPSHPPLSRHGSGTRQPPRILWEPGGRPQNAAASLERTRHIEWQQPQNPASLKQPAPSVNHVRPSQPPQAAQYPAQLPACHVKMPRPLHAGPELQSPPMQAHMSAQAPPSAEASQQRGSVASMLPCPVAASSPSLYAAAARVQTGDTEEAVKASAEPYEEQVPEQAAPFSIDWDDWHPAEDLHNDPAEQPEPLPEINEPGAADVDCVQDSLEDDEEPAQAAGCEPDLTPCKTATKGMQLDK